ncbi:ligand-binding sensor domain-containing protein [Paraflavitalea speifideaquila]|uniref:ligand-binding sensor domain-containing protein n=1 Tax=Paraflavitalea speifideaquila TaxID=3076558 RepID=UPI0028EFB88B|nr:two-component regulator propeller domain-containing protein [Paraflavitalea speifideiaquila]
MLLIWVNVGAAAQPGRFIFEHLTIHDGLLSNLVSAVMQDSKGFIWLGTNNGLQRYDGEGFVNWRTSVGCKNCLPSDIIYKLLEDKDHQIWIITNAGVVILNPATFTFKQVTVLTDPPYTLPEVFDFFRIVKEPSGYPFPCRGCSDTIQSNRPLYPPIILCLLPGAQYFIYRKTCKLVIIG